MSIPQAFDRSHDRDGKKKVCILFKSLYGLKQISRQQNLKLTHSLIQHGYSHSKFDYSLFSKIVNGHQVHLLVYVDDLVISRSSEQMICELKVVLKSHFKLKDLGRLQYFLGLEIARSASEIVVYQRKHVLKLIMEVGLMEGNQQPHIWNKTSNSLMSIMIDYLG